jgi:hypothetical protein
MQVNGKKNMFDMGDSEMNLYKFRNMQKVIRHNGGLVFVSQGKTRIVDGKSVEVSETEEERSKKAKHAEVFMAHMVKIYGELPK